MRRLCLTGLVAGSIFLTAVPLAAHPSHEKPRAQNAWVREIPPGQAITAAFLEIENPNPAADYLISVACDCAKTVEIHRMVQDGDRMKMKPVEQIKVPAGGKVELVPGGLHLMLFWTKPLRQGEKVRFRLRFTHAGDVEVEAPVRAVEGNAGAEGAGIRRSGSRPVLVRIVETGPGRFVLSGFFSYNPAS